MSSITAQQAKLDPELVPKEKRLDIGKCNRRLNPRKIQREPLFQVVLDALALTPCYSAFLIIADILEGEYFDALPTDEEIMSFLRDLGHTREINSLNDVVVDQMHQPWRTFASLINRSLSGKTTGLDNLRLSRAQILWATPPKKARKFKKPASPQLSTVPVSSEEPTMKSKRVKRPAKKSTKAPARGVVIRETPECQCLRRRKRWMLLETHPSGSGTITKTAPSAAKIKPSVKNEGTSVKPGVPDVTKEESSKNSEHETNENESDSESDHQENKEEDEDDEEEEEDELLKTSSNDSDDEGKITDKAEGDEDEEIDYTTSQLYDDVDIRLNELVDTDKGFIQEEGTDVEITNIQQGNENPEITYVIEDAHVALSTIP
ncbi:hypothetical protein Tco_0409809 [Tanacetum coccineum]